MSIIELGALGEFLGSIGVIATLIYLAIQIRSGARTAATDARQRVLDRFADATSNIIHSDFSVSLWKVLNDEEPAEVETRQLYNIMIIFAVNMYNAIRLHDEGVLDDEAFEYISTAFVQTCAMPGGNIWWNNYLRFAPKTLSEFVNKRLEGQSTRPLAGILAESEENEQ